MAKNWCSRLYQIFSDFNRDKDSGESSEKKPLAVEYAKNRYFMNKDRQTDAFDIRTAQIKICQC